MLRKANTYASNANFQHLVYSDANTAANFDLLDGIVDASFGNRLSYAQFDSQAGCDIAATSPLAAQGSDSVCVGALNVAAR